MNRGRVKVLFFKNVCVNAFPLFHVFHHFDFTCIFIHMDILMHINSFFLTLP